MTTVDTKTLVSTIGYLIGVNYDKLVSNYGDTESELLQSLSSDRPATIIRYLNRLKTSLMKNFKKTDLEIKNNLKNLDRLDWFNPDEIKQLEEWGIPIIIANHKAGAYVEDISQLLTNNIDNCKHLFEDWINFDYIKGLFCIPKQRKGDFFKNEFTKYMTYRAWYPFAMYIYWEPEDAGNILLNDAKFLDILYKQHNDTFTDRSKTKNVGEEVKKSIYDFIREAEKVSLVVDCENSDVFKLYSVLKNLDPDELAKINKIILYDDYHTTRIWNILHKHIQIPIEHIDVERVTDRKSLVDIRLTAGVCKAYYTENVDSFILVSSDSDYWGLISSVPDAKFLVMYEYNKCGYEIKQALAEKEIFSCSIDDFCSSGNTVDFKRSILFASLEEHFPHLLEINGKDLARMIFQDNLIPATDKEIDVFYNRYIRTLRLKCDHEGNFSIEIDKY